MKGAGFCPRHFWMANRVEDDGWPAGGIGVAALCESLVERVITNLPRDSDLTRRERMGPFRVRRQATVPQSGSGCIFCRRRIEREYTVLDTLQYLKNKTTWSERLAQPPLCLYHGLMAL
jgi:hypothetical protein